MGKDVGWIPMTDPESQPPRWRRRDALMGMMFLGTGVLMIWYAMAAFENGVFLHIGTAALGGLLLVVVGGNAVVRAWAAGR